jgi:Flp pilus assembly protein TadB
MVVLFWAGSTMLLAELRSFHRPSLAERLRPYAIPELAEIIAPRRSLDLRGAVAPVVDAIGARLSRVLGVTEGTETRLERMHSDLDTPSFRLRQLGWCLASLLGTVTVVVVLEVPPLVAAVAVLASPVLAFLAVEQRLAERCRHRQRRLFLELPVVSEQIGMLLGAGYSLGGAMGRVGERGRGACAEDLRHVRGRIQHGLSEIDALREWAELADVDAVHRLVGVLALNHDMGDLGQLITEEARQIRQEVHRETLELIERRSEQVWIPVTVATLLPGVLFLAVPFIEAMKLFSSA